MICKNHERQPSFLGTGCGKTGKKFRKQRTNSEGQSLPLKKVHCFSFWTLCNGRDNQVPSQPTCLCFMVQLQKIIGHAHKIPFQ